MEGCHQCNLRQLDMWDEYGRGKHEFVLIDGAEVEIVACRRHFTMVVERLHAEVVT